ncbi:MAG TPA: TlpA family protein disulfide reductase [Candidatus Gemmiger excrementipullorum]|uniref:TlpA family protein disulfide reductase n=1 Tax=Candidatus Gemmiger excrementipullorum TaxID=2838610 RepID=A0A9D1Y1Q5_9FIRM|nr:TlpA family protein disulfide reductase [Candidatus Gemmiger excrementipullorum]
MKDRKTLVLLVLAFAIVLAGAYLLYDRLGSQYAPDQLAVESTPVPADTAESTADSGDTQQTAEDAEAQRTAAPDFTAYDADGNAVQLSDYFGKPLVLNFWASWCGPCKSEMPAFQQAYEQEDGVQFLLVNMTGGRETQADAEALLEEEGYTFPVLFDLDLDAAMTYGVTALPTTYFLDAEGNLVAWAQGAINEQTLQQGLDMIRPAA